MVKVDLVDVRKIDDYIRSVLIAVELGELPNYYIYHFRCLIVLMILCTFANCCNDRYLHIIKSLLQ